MLFDATMNLMQKTDSTEVLMKSASSRLASLAASPHSALNNKKRARDDLTLRPDANPCVPAGNLPTACRHYGTRNDLCPAVKSTLEICRNLATAADLQ